MKKCKLIVDGKEIVCQISEEQLAQLQENKKTGYERVTTGENYFAIDECGEVNEYEEEYCLNDNVSFNVANYYSDRTLAENDERYYRLHRQLKRFAVENRKKKIDWEDGKHVKYYLSYRPDLKEIEVLSAVTTKDFSQIYFDSQETAERAVEKFKDELIWYFTEYKDSL